MAARRRDKVELPPQPVPQVEGQLPLFPNDGPAWWTQRPEWSLNPPDETDASGSAGESPWDSGEEG